VTSASQRVDVIVTQMSAEQDDFLTVAEIAEILKMNPQTIRNWIDAGKLPAHRVGRRVRVTRADFDAVVREGRTTNTPIPRPTSGSYTADDFWGGVPLPSPG